MPLALNVLLPDYRNSIVNLAASLGAARGATGLSHPPLPPAITGLLDQRHLLLFIVDGLGDNWLSHNAPEGFVARHRRGRLTSVFPTTTASAITSLFTATEPCEHGITGWFTWFRELGSVAAVLPFTPRRGGSCYTDYGVQPADVMGANSLFDHTDAECHVINPHYITDSAYSRTTAGPARRHGYRSLEEMFKLAEQVVRHSKAEQTLTYIYWSELDALGHARGIGSPEALSAFRQFETGLQRFIGTIRGLDVAVLLSADHGMIDVDPAQRIDLADHPHLKESLSLPLCGEPRMAYCYLHSGHEDRFLNYIGEWLGHAGGVRRAMEALDGGWFGSGPHHPELHHRIGDYLLLMRDHFVVSEQLTGEKPFHSIGTHGGLHPDELYVPLVCFHLP